MGEWLSEIDSRFINVMGLGLPVPNFLSAVVSGAAVSFNTVKVQFNSHNLT